MAGRKIILILVMLEFCLSNSACHSESKRDRFIEGRGSGKQFSSPNELDKYLRRMVIGKRLTFASDLDENHGKQASAADLGEYMKMWSFVKYPASSKAMDRFFKKIFSEKRPDVDEDQYKKSSGKFVEEKKSFASFRWRPVDGKTFVFYIQLISSLKR